MKYLLDTHTFIWLDHDPSQLSPTVTAICQDRQQTLLLSVVSVWEIIIKQQIGKLTLRLPLADIVTQQCQQNDVQILPITLPHTLEVAQLPLVHKDPFDRLLIAQSRVENAVLLSADHVFASYPVQVLW
jgi:PIN domain nuclease of toxin-antitoxin system